MAGPIAKVSMMLNGGMDNRTESELTQPIITQGAIAKLKASVNTRLSVRPGGVVRSPRFTQLPGTTGYQFDIPGEPAYAMAASANGESTAVIRPSRRSTGAYLYGDAGRSSLGSTTIGFLYGSPSAQMNVGVARIEDAGSVGSAKSLRGIATTYHEATDVLWRAWLSPRLTTDSTTATLVVSAESLEGVQYAGPRTVVSDVAIAPLAAWVGITSHGVNGVRLWWTGPTSIHCATLFVNSGSRPEISQQTIVGSTPTTSYGIDVCSGGDDSAVLLTATGSDARLHVISTVDNTLRSNEALTGALTGGGQVAVSSMQWRGARRVVACASSVTNNVTTYSAWTLAAHTLTQSWAPSTFPGRGRVACGFLDGAPGIDAPMAVYAVSRVDSGVASGDVFAEHVQTDFLYRGLLDGAPPLGGSPPRFRFRTLQTCIAQWSPVEGVTCPVFGLAPTYGPDANLGDPDYADDPAITLHAVGAHFTTPAPIARVGCVRFVQAPARIQLDPMMVSKTMEIVGQTVVMTYTQQPDVGVLAAKTGYPGRHVRITLSPSQASVAHDRDGAAMIAGAVPLIWDGREFSDFGGIAHTPHLAAVPYGVGTVLPVGTYRLRAVQRWTDATGCLRRSRPSALRTITLASPSAIAVRVTEPSSVMTSAVIENVLYASELGGKTEGVADVSTNRIFVGFTPNPAGALVYTTEAEGAEKAPQPPPPAADIAIIGARCWILDGEVRSRFVYSKYRVAGVGYEFHPSFEVILPSGAGRGMAAREWGGLPLLLAERGVYQTSGDGPQNTGLNGSYSTPSKVSDFGCSNTASVAVYPGGLIWQFGSRFVTCTGAGIQLVPDFVCTHDVSAAVVLTRYSEVLFFSATVAEVRVYNYEFGRWSIWDSETLPDPVNLAALMPYDPDCVMVYSQSTGITRRLDAASISAAAHMHLETDWVLLGGDFQDHVIVQDLVFSAAVAGPHGLEIDMWTDYSAAPTTSRSWSAAEVATMAGTLGRYTVRIEPVQPNARAVKLRVRDVVAPGESNTQGFAPRALTVRFSLNGQLFEESFTPHNIAFK